MGATAAEQDEWQSEVLEARQHYFYNSQYAAAHSGPRIVGVCCCKNTHHLFLQSSGRHVIVFDGEKYEVRWITEAELRKQATLWGFTPEQIAALGLDKPKQP